MDEACAEKQSSFLNLSPALFRYALIQQQTFFSNNQPYVEKVIIKHNYLSREISFFIIIKHGMSRSVHHRYIQNKNIR